MSHPVKLFYCYAREDSKLRNELAKHLTVLHRAGLTSSWYDGEMLPGTMWEEEVKKHLHTADVILLLVSADFIKSDQCYTVELTHALTRHINKQAWVIPILLSPVYWERTPFHKLQLIPTDSTGELRPVIEWRNREKAWVHVVKQIDRVVKEMSQRASTEQTNPLVDFKQSCRDGPSLLTASLFTLAASGITGACAFFYTRMSTSIPLWVATRTSHLTELSIGISVILLVLVSTLVFQWWSYFNPKWIYLYKNGFIYDKRGVIQEYFWDEILSVNLHTSVSGGGNQPVSIRHYYVIKFVDGRKPLTVNNGAALQERFEHYRYQREHEIEIS